jgi:hypothetical protein
MTQRRTLHPSTSPRPRGHDITTEVIFALFLSIMLALATVILSSLASDAELIMPMRGKFISAIALTFAVIAGVAFAITSVVVRSRHGTAID